MSASALNSLTTITMGLEPAPKRLEQTTAQAESLSQDTGMVKARAATLEIAPKPTAVADLDLGAANTVSNDSDRYLYFNANIYGLSEVDKIQPGNQSTKPVAICSSA